jgi:hypothetical protein
MSLIDSTLPSDGHVELKEEREKGVRETADAHDGQSGATMNGEMNGELNAINETHNHVDHQSGRNI